MRTAPARVTATLIAVSATVLAACGASPHSANMARVAAPPPAISTSAPASVDVVAPAPTAGSAAPSSRRATSPAPARPRSTAPAPGAVGSAHASSAAPPAPAAPSSAAHLRATPQAPAALTPACTLAALRVEAMRGGASMGEEYALLTFTNDAATVCRVSGYPSLGLRAAGSAVGSSQPAQTSGSGSVTLHSGASAQVRVRVATDCPAARSDHVRVSVPSAGGFVEVPLQMRGCTLQVGAFQPAT